MLDSYRGKMENFIAENELGLSNPEGKQGPCETRTRTATAM